MINSLEPIIVVIADLYFVVLRQYLSIVSWKILRISCTHAQGDENLNRIFGRSYRYLCV